MGTRLPRDSVFWLGVVTLTVSSFLLLSMGGAIVAAPLSVPLMFYVARRHPSKPFKVIGGVVTALTVGEVTWALVYVSIGESEPWIWVLPLVMAVAASVVFAGWVRGRLTLRPS